MQLRDGEFGGVAEAAIGAGEESDASSGETGGGGEHVAVQSVIPDDNWKSKLK